MVEVTDLIRLKMLLFLVFNHQMPSVHTDFEPVLSKLSKAIRLLAKVINVMTMSTALVLQDDDVFNVVSELFSDMTPGDALECRVRFHDVFETLIGRNNPTFSNLKNRLCRTVYDVVELARKNKAVFEYDGTIDDALTLLLDWFGFDMAFHLIQLTYFHVLGTSFALIVCTRRSEMNDKYNPTKSKLDNHDSNGWPNLARVFVLRGSCQTGERCMIFHCNEKSPDSGKSPAQWTSFLDVLSQFPRSSESTDIPILMHGTRIPRSFDFSDIVFKLFLKRMVLKAVSEENPDDQEPYVALSVLKSKEASKLKGDALRITAKRKKNPDDDNNDDHSIIGIEKALRTSTFKSSWCALVINIGWRLRTSLAPLSVQKNAHKGNVFVLYGNGQKKEKWEAPIENVAVAIMNAINDSSPNPNKRMKKRH